MISTNDGDQFDGVDESKFELRGDTLYYNNKQVENTYLIFNITFEQLKGDDQKANWFKKYNEALNNLDKILLTDDETEKAKIYKDSKDLWYQGNALIDADLTYIDSERIKIKNVAINTINIKYKSLTKPTPEFEVVSAKEILKGLTGTTNFNIVREALPATGRFLHSSLKLNPEKPLGQFQIAGLNTNEKKLSELLNKDNKNYLLDLEKNKINFNLRL